MALDENSALGCGRTIEEVWANIDHPPIAHEASCEHCIAARDSLRTLQEITARSRAAEQRADEDPSEDLHPSPRVRANVIAIARAEVRRARRVPVVTTELGPILISEQTLLALVRAAIDTVSGLRARHISTTGLVGVDGAPIGPGQGARVVRITCRVAVAPGVVIPVATVTARQRILAATARHLHLGAEAVDITVEDLYDR